MNSNEIKETTRKLMEIFNATKKAIEMGASDEQILSQVPEGSQVLVTSMIQSIRS